jgi:hypothetical protein
VRCGRQFRRATLFVAVFMMTWLPTLVARAQQDGPDYVGAKPPTVGGAVSRNAATAVGGHTGELPRTGIAIATLVVVALALIVIGRILQSRSRNSG